MLILWILLMVLTAKDHALAIKLIEIRVPKHAAQGHSVLLECLYDMEGEALYSVKWYKDGSEFYRYLPRDDPPEQTFPIEGITVDVRNSTNSHVMLESVNLASSGKYRCEVSAEAPSFQTVAENSEMMVVVLPDSDPAISGGNPRYQIGDYVRVNCTSGRSKPAVQLSWYINSELADPSYVRHYPRIVSLAPDHLETSILGLEFRIKPKHFRRGDLKLKCLATISSVYWKSNEESMECDKPQKSPILESRKSGLSQTTRADRVHGMDKPGSRHEFSQLLTRMFSTLFQQAVMEFLD
uniref:Ig-like domain-containing protein n=1 Tax=Anopheles stephensi TaxID=30069 RepID=A0A182YGT9_ANOST